MANRRERRAAETGPIPALLATALGLYQGGRLAEAERAYRDILERAPRNPDALYQFGVLAGQTGRLAVAEQCLGDAVGLRPSEPALHTALGLLRAMQHRFADAVACHDKALALDTSHVGALVGRGEALRELGDLAGAEAAYQRAAALVPGAWEIRFGWATALTDLGRLTQAVEVYRALIALNPGSAEAHFNLASVLRDLGRLDEAAVSFEAALAANSDISGGAIELVSTLCELGRLSEALDRAVEAMRRTPQPPGARLAFATVAALSGPLDYSPEISVFLEQCLEADDVSHEDLAKAAAWQLRMKHRLDRAPAESVREAVETAIESTGAAGCLADRHLHLLLATTVNRDLALETFLTAVRRRLCFIDALPAGLHPFMASLALQGWNNNYVFGVADDEEARIAALQAELEAELSSFAGLTPALEREILRFALYAPLMALTGSAKLLETPTEKSSASLGAVLRRCLADPQEEAALARALPSHGAIADAVSRAVRDQYEENPYPRWFSLPSLTPVSLPVMLRRKFPHVALPAFLAEPLEILVAGCGTGRQPITTAQSIAESRVLAVDLSRSSLAYASRMARRLGVSNVSFLQADLLALGGLGREFPMIEAVGVLHHLADPMAGWRVLSGLLRPGGFMRVGLYSELARGDVVAARDRIAALGLGPTARDIRAFRQRILFGAETERLPSLPQSKDVFDLSGCRDLLFHAQEHRFALLELDRMMVVLGLEFVGFEFEAAGIPRRYRAQNPDDLAMTDLTCWARFEAAHPDAFSGMYNFWCVKPLH